MLSNGRNDFYLAPDIGAPPASHPVTRRTPSHMARTSLESGAVPPGPGQEPHQVKVNLEAFPLHAGFSKQQGDSDAAQERLSVRGQS
jgi:hypothetical protein